MRTIDVTNGGKEYAVAKVTEANGADLSTATYQVGLGTQDTPPASWVAPSTTAFPSTGTAVVSLLVDNATAVASGRVLWVKVTDGPEVLILRAGNDTITIK